MSKQDLKIVFLGTPEFAVPTLKALVDENLKPFLVITQPDKPSGRKKELTPPPVKVFAQKSGLEIKQPKNKKELAEIFSDIEVDVCLLVAFGMIIPQEVLDKPKHGFINIHPSLLPKYRGPSPVQAAILNGEKKTGVTIMKLTAEMDAGPIITQQEVDILESENAQTLRTKMAQIGARAVVDILPNYLADKVKLTEQDDNEATYCKIIKREDGKIDWSKKALEIINQFRAFTPWPGIFTYLGDKRLKITDLSLLGGNFDRNLPSGQVFLGPNKELCVMAGDQPLVIDKVQLEGKKESLGKEFLNGRKDLVGTILK